MKRLSRIAIIALIIIVQLWVVIVFTLGPVNLAGIPYRFAERHSALDALVRDQSPENKATYRRELQLATHHTLIQQLTRTGIVFVVLLSFEAFLIYWGRKNEGEPKPAA